MNTEEPIAETRRPHPHRKLATNTANVGKRSSARQIPGKNKDFGPKSDGNGSLFRTGNKRHQSIQQTPDRDHERSRPSCDNRDPRSKSIYEKPFCIYLLQKGCPENKIRPAPQRAR